MNRRSLFLYICVMKALISVLLSALIFLSSSGLAFAKHYCGGYEMLSKITFGEEHLSCGMKMNVPACGEEDFEDHHCCSNRYLKVTTDDQFSKVTFEYDFTAQWFPIFVEVFILPEYIAADVPFVWIDSYHAPPLERDVQILYETFLI